MLIVGGFISAFIAVYGNREDSHIDELATYAGFVLGIVMCAMAFFVALDKTVNWFTLVLLILVAVTLFLKPMKDIPWAGLVGFIAGALVIYGLSFIMPDKILGVDRWIPMVIIFLFVGAIVHFLFHFLEDTLEITRRILNWRPVMLIIGGVAIVEGVALALNSSLLSLF